MGHLSFLKALILLCIGAASGFLLGISNGQDPTVGPGSVGFAPFVGHLPSEGGSAKGNTEELVALEAQPEERVPMGRAAIAPKPEGGPYIAVSELAKTMGTGWVTKEYEGAEVTGPLVEGIRHGKTTVRNPTTGGYAEGTYFLGARHGKWTLHSPEGVLLQEHQYFGGKRNGDTRFRTSAEDPWMYVTYKDDELVQDE